MQPETMMGRGILITVSGPTGSGKSTLMRHALARFPKLRAPQSYTTRPRRADAVENGHYTFVSVDAFMREAAAGAFLEHALFGGNWYGTRKDEVLAGLARGEVLYKEMEVQGVRQVKAVLPRENLITVFVDAGSWEISRARAIAREPMSDEALEKRRAHFEEEMAFKPEADVVIYNLEGRYREAEDAFEAVIAGALKKVQGA